MSGFNKGGKLVIDADGCPVTKLAARLAREYGTDCLIVCDSVHIFNAEDTFGARVATVSQGADSADFFIVNHINSGDLIVTQDYGLAAMALARGACAVNQDGRTYTDENISWLLESRAANKKLLRAGKHPKGAPKRRNSQNEEFEKSLRRIFENAKV